MAQWQALLQLDSGLQRQVSQLYERTFSREIRHYNQFQNEPQNLARILSHCLKEEKKILALASKTQIVLQQLCGILNHTSQVVATLTDVELPKWKHRQQMACIGSPVDTSLDHLQKWFTVAAEVIVGIREQLLKLQEQNNKYNCTDASSLAANMVEIQKFALSLLTKLLTNALVVEKQPVMQNFSQRPLILKTGVGFKAKCKLINCFNQHKLTQTSCCRFRHFEFGRDDKKVLDVEPPGALIAEFRNMIRLGVTEELHIIKFVTELEYAGLKCDIEASSLPLIVVSSTNQVASAWASIMWCKLSDFAVQNLSLFVDPPPLIWEQLAQVLSWQFLSVGERELDEDQLSMLRDKIAGEYLAELFIGFTKFSSKVSNESPWIWIDGILDLIKKHLVDLWRDGYIMGFVSRERTEFLLKPKRPGTFVLRFSETNKDGAISFSWVDHTNGEPHVHAVRPFIKKELLSMSLSDLIYHYILTHQGETKNPLLYLYPDIHIDTAFRRYGIIPTPPPSPPTEPMDVSLNFYCQFSAVL
uniref:Signal transducer and activator of transcription 1b n=1 Tax=Acanthochromis polyacanthus TaxID=80966 RepID=A0A3Q1FAF8_9TELE